MKHIVVILGLLLLISIIALSITIKYKSKHEVVVQTSVPFEGYLVVLDGKDSSSSVISAEVINGLRLQHIRMNFLPILVLSSISKIANPPSKEGRNSWWERDLTYSQIET